MNTAYLIKNIEAYAMIIELAQANGKVAGQSMKEEFEQVRQEHPEWFEVIGHIDMDVDLLGGELRERGVKVFNFNELRDLNKEQSDGPSI